MQPPRRLRIGNHVFEVLVSRSGLVGEHSETRGSTVVDALTIALDGRLPRSLRQETVLHEALHAMWEASALPASSAKDHEELVVTALAPVLLDVLRRNPKLVEFLLA